MHKKHKLACDQYEEIKKPKEIYLPLIIGNDTDLVVLVKVGDHVYKETMVAYNKGKFKSYLHSSISGTIKAIEDKTYSNGQKVKCLIIENDYKEQVQKRTGVKEEINNYSKEEFIEIIKNAGIVGLSGNGFPTYVKYDTDKKIKTLIVNAIECEPYLTADYTILKNKYREILEAIDAILDINKIDECLICISKRNRKLIKLLNQYTGTYLRIKIVSIKNAYPMGWEKGLIKEATGLTYDGLPSECGIIVNNVSTIYAIYKALKSGTPLLERIITISGELAPKHTNVLAKIGTPIKDIIGEVDSNNVLIIAGGPMMGHALVDFDTMVTKQANGLLLIKKEDRQETACIHCGKCLKYCPCHLAPILVKGKNKDELKKLNVDKCMDCGLCSYVCPARIPLKDYMDEAKKSIKEVSHE